MVISMKTIAGMLICLVISMACVKRAETLSECAKQCMPVCLKEKGATIAVCGPACEKYCQQISGNSRLRAKQS
ncbi:hypothetical protein LR48_Vigan02g052300 [Vigna angularis]|uniref:Uncharacterized protein n=1 Tax=Phaseolus angularis TaxID=3914 RepID=A0A0L9TUV6_PHAAN|nr:hypothetical protein LR48_Vigan02g052300 [Vigna angularis]